MIKYIIFWTFILIKLLPISIGVANFKFLPKAYKVILLLTFCAMITEALGQIQNHYHTENNTIFYNIYLLVESELLLFVGSMLADRKYVWGIVKGLLVVFPVYWGYLFITEEEGRFFNWYFVSYSIVAVLLFTYVLLFKVLFGHDKLYKSHLFYLCVGIAFYSVTIIPLFSMMSYLFEDDLRIAKWLYQINNLSNLLRYLLTAIAFWLCAKQAKRIGYAKQ